ncbi:Tigger transposable element-derived protein 6 [Araneus ventricosus]|uniref:Tigger transposable element-derived protein 6 n=1 Tax=Araneus ventricosus TaxID=182803 RepID=A0A4Y2EKP9_ARAVE|nr:Tigger transposable element-derived protein 6 [Araneus ventricosus]
MKWFCSARAKNIPVNGVLLQEKAKEIGESLGLETFKASNGWLEKFRTRHNISFKQICGEEKSVNPNEVTDWFGKLKSLLKGYDDRDIFNADETDLFYRVLPEKTSCLEGKKCSGGKISKERLTLLLCCNMLEDFEIPVVIGKAKKPRCFKNIDVRKLSVSWKSNKKAWITTEIMSDCEELAKSVSVLDAISWTTSALKKVEPGCVLKYFKKAGFLSTSEVATDSTTEKRERELADLVANLDSNVSVEEYVKIDDDLSIEEENLHVSNFIH